MARVEREKQLQLENSSIRLQAAELEATNLKEEVTRQRIRIEKLETERKQLTDQIMDLRNEIVSSKEQENSFKEQERRLNQEREAQSQLIGSIYCFVSQQAIVIVLFVCRGIITGGGTVTFGSPHARTSDNITRNVASGRASRRNVSVTSEKSTIARSE